MTTITEREMTVKRLAAFHPPLSDIPRTAALRDERMGAVGAIPLRELVPPPTYGAGLYWQDEHDSVRIDWPFLLGAIAAYVVVGCVALGIGYVIARSIGWSR